jgi:HEPN domain-containing protein
MQDPNEWQRWIKQAEYDSETATYNFQGGFHALACFLAQQTAEKALKAFLYAQGERAVLGHSVADLCKRCAQVNHAFQPLIADVGKLDRFYVPTRYPNGLPGGVPAETYDAADSVAALGLANQVLSLVRQLTGGEEKES